MPSCSVCVVGLKCYDLLARAEVPRFMGGAERQQVLIARGLAESGFDVSFVTFDQGQPDGIVHDGITILRAHSPDEGLPVLRFLHPRWTKLVSALKRADADIYHQMAAGTETGQVAHACRSIGGRKRGFVYSIASDSDCDVRLPLLGPWRERAFYRYGLRHADSVISQTQRQWQMLREAFEVDSTVIPMPCVGPSEDEYVAPTSPTDGSSHVLWVGRIDQAKRLEWLFDVAEQCPGTQFDVVGAANEESAYATDLLRRAEGIDNVAMHGRVPEPEMPLLYQRAACLCCTSVFEGFPNTFLEAWSNGLPIVSTFDPDDIIAREKLGFVAGSVEELVGHIERMTTSPDVWRQASTTARRYYLANHTIQSIVPRFERVFQDVLG